MDWWWWSGLWRLGVGHGVVFAQSQIAVDGEGLQVVVAFGGDEADVVAVGVVGLDVEHDSLVVEGERHIVLFGLAEGVPAAYQETVLAGLVGMDEEVDPVAEGRVVDVGAEGEGGGVAVDVHQGTFGVGAVGVLGYHVVDGLLQQSLLHAVDLDEACAGGKGLFDEAFGIALFASRHEQ